MLMEQEMYAKQRWLGAEKEKREDNPPKYFLFFNFIKICYLLT